MSTYKWKKRTYSYDGFYAASPVKDCDLFLCLENGQVYLPAANELFIFTEPQRVGSIRKAYDGWRQMLLRENQQST